MDPEGIREVFFAECGAAADYGIRRALRSLPVPNRFQESFFYGVHLPLTRPLPKRLDTVMAQRTGLHAFDAVVLADIDPVVFDAVDLLNLVAYVEGGGGLLLFAGPNSFSKAQRDWGPLRAIMPAEIDFQPQKKTKLWNTEFMPELPRPATPLVPAMPHAILRGLDHDLGLVRNIHRMFPTPQSVLLANAGVDPVIVAATRGRGRMVMVSAFPSTEPDCLFRTTAWTNLLRQVLLWLMKRDADLRIADWSCTASALKPKTEWKSSMRIQGDAPGPIRAVASARQADPGWLAVGRDPQYGEPEPLPVTIAGQTVSVQFTPPSSGLWQIDVSVSGDQWSNSRTAEIVAASPLNLQLASRDSAYVTAPGRTLPLEIRSETPVRGHLRIRDFDGREVLRQGSVETGAVDVAVPHLETGDYEAEVEASGETARFRFAVVEPLREMGLSFVAGASGATEERAQWWYDYFRQRGFNVFYTSPPPPVTPGSPAPAFRCSPFISYRAQKDGLDLAGYGMCPSILSTHAHYGDEGTKPTRPCVWTPEYAESYRKRFEPLFRAMCQPRMTSLEILDEPHLMRANVCHCEVCKARFRKRFGYAMPTWDEALAARGRKTVDYFEWVVDYAAEAFRQGFRLWKSFGKGPLLNHVLCGIGSGQISIRHAVAEDLPWSPHADFIEFDCYNYMYPSSRCAIPLRWNHFHYLAGHFRFLTRRNRQRLGFWIQVTDREVPVAPYDPLRAPSETLYTALGHGAKVFHLMAKGPFSTTQNCREEKFDTLATDILKVRQSAPLLNRAQRPPSRVAMIFPFHDRLYRPPAHYLPPGYKGLGFYGVDARPVDTTWPYHMAPINVAELVFRAFGDVDVIDQRALREGALKDYGGFVLTATDWMDEADARAIRAFVQDGGALVCDHVPTHALSGRALRTLTPLFAGQPEPFYRDVTVARSAFGAGMTLLFSHDLQDLYSTAVEQGNHQLRHRLKDTIRGFLDAQDLRPHVRSSRYEIEANLLLTPDTMVLVPVNHGESRLQARLTVFSPPVPATAAVDLVTSEPLTLEQVPEGLALHVDLDEREGQIIGLFPALPTHSTVNLRRSRIRAGESLAFDVELTDAAGTRVRGDHVVSVEVRDPAGELRHAWSGLHCASNGRLSISAPLAINARAGTWTVSVFDRLTTRQHVVPVTVTAGRKP